MIIIIIIIIKKTWGVDVDNIVVGNISKVIEKRNLSI